MTASVVTTGWRVDSDFASPGLVERIPWRSPGRWVRFLGESIMGAWARAVVNGRAAAKDEIRKRLGRSPGAGDAAVQAFQARSAAATGGPGSGPRWNGQLDPQGIRTAVPRKTDIPHFDRDPTWGNGPVFRGFEPDSGPCRWNGPHRWKGRRAIAGEVAVKAAQVRRDVVKSTVSPGDT
ncbi:MAG TPA: hypothetical protein VI138_03280 [Candidatus Dormibacteraeota bacterium]